MPEGDGAIKFSHAPSFFSQGFECFAAMSTFSMSPQLIWKKFFDSPQSVGRLVLYIQIFTGALILGSVVSLSLYLACWPTLKGQAHKGTSSGGS